MSSDLVGLLPRDSGRQTVEALGLVVLEPPMDLPPVNVQLASQQRYDADGAHRWLRTSVRAAIADLSST